MDLSLIGQHCAECGAPIRAGQAVCDRCRGSVVDPVVNQVLAQAESNPNAIREYAGAGGCKNVAAATLMLYALEEGERDAPTAAACLKATSSPAVLRELVVLLGTRRWLDHPVSPRLFEASRGPLNIATIIRDLFSAGGELRRSALLECLTSSSDRVREAAADLLQYSRGPEVVAPLVKALRTDRDPTVRARAAYALGQCRDPSCADELIHALHDESPLVQSKAAQSLSRLGADALSGAANSLQTGSPEVALQSARLLGQMGGPEAIRALIDALRNRRDLVRLYAEQALVSIGIDVVRPLLEELIKHSDSVGMREGVAYVFRTMRLPDRERDLLKPVVQAAERLDAGIEMPSAAYQALGVLEGSTVEQLKLRLGM